MHQMYSKSVCMIFRSKVRAHTFTLEKCHVKQIPWNPFQWTYYLAKTRHPTATLSSDQWVWKIFISPRLITAHVKIPDVKCSPTSKLKYKWNFGSFPSRKPFKNTVILGWNIGWWFFIPGHRASSSRDSLVSRTTTRLSCEPTSKLFIQSGSL